MKGRGLKLLAKVCSDIFFFFFFFDKDVLTKYFPTQRQSFLGFLPASKQICGNIIKDQKEKPLIMKEE